MPDIINPNNLLISDGKFILVDKLEKVPFKEPNSVYTMLEPLIIRMTPEKEASHSNKLTNIRKNIFRKVLIASEKCELPLDSPVKYEYADWILNDVIGIKNNVISDLIRMRNCGVSLDERIDTINRILSV